MADHRSKRQKGSPKLFADNVMKLLEGLAKHGWTKHTPSPWIHAVSKTVGEELQSRIDRMSKKQIEHFLEVAMTLNHEYKGNIFEAPGVKPLYEACMGC